MARHARHARHLGSQLGDARLRRDDLHRRALRRPHHRPARRVLAGLAARSTSTSIRRRSTRTSRSTCRSSATARTCWRTCCGCGGPRRCRPTRRRSTRLVEADRASGARASRSPTRTRSDIIKPQYAIERLYELTKDRDTYITTEVGQHQMWAAQFYQLRGAEPLDDLRRARHHGLRPAGRGRRAAGASRIRWSSTSPAKPRCR